MTRALLALLLLTPQQEKKVSWTLLVYMAADNDLDPNAEADLQEMVSAFATDDARVVVLVDRIDAPAKRLLLQKGATKELADLGEVNTGDGKVLADFVTWALKTYPADRTAILFWNHGEGWPGFGGDESHDNDSLTLDEIDRALGTHRFDLIGFDACLMATLEAMRMARAHGRIFVASEEMEPSDGWAYGAILESLSKNPKQDATALAKTIADSFAAFYREHEDGGWTTLSVVDLDKLPAVQAAVDALAEKLSATLTAKNWIQVARARFRTEEYGRDGDTGIYQIDLHHWATNLKGFGCDDLCDAVIRAVESAVIHRVNGADVPNGRGIAIYLPPAKDPHDELEKELKLQYAGPAKWTAFVQTYMKIGALDTVPPKITGLAATDEDGLTVLRAEVKDEDVAKVYLALAQKKQILGVIPSIVENAQLEDYFDGTWLAITDGKNRMLAAMTSFDATEDEDVYLVGVPARYQAPKSKEWDKVTLYFEADWSGDEFRGAFAYAFKFTDIGPAEVDLAEGGKLQPFQVSITEKGKFDLQVPKTPVTLTLGKDGPSFVEEALPKGTYSLGFLVRDLAGNAAQAWTDVKVE